MSYASPNKWYNNNYVEKQWSINHLSQEGDHSEWDILENTILDTTVTYEYVDSND